MFLVTGGYGESGHMFDSMETYDPMLGSWATSGAKLPRPMVDPKAANINDRVLIFGNLKFLVLIIPGLRAQVLQTLS